MSVQYQAVLWNRQKRVYDITVAGGVVVYLAAFVGTGALIHPSATIETLLIRSLGTAALLLLHVVLAIGPLCRLNTRFLPLLYNRRHLGVITFVLALAHGTFSLVQFHALGDVNPLVSLLTSNTRFDRVAEFPFQQLGLAALVILFLMAATSHDFWLHTLGPPLWKRLHMLVYFGYGLVVGHVALGALQSERSPLYPALLGSGMAVLFTLHLAAGLRERLKDREQSGTELIDAGEFATIPNHRARVINSGAERIAVFRQDERIFALSNVCRHQNGPLGEGRIVDGCVTCPWHGYQYDPASGCSPPPFTDKVATFGTQIVNGRVYVDPRPLRAP
jgi:methionine sulfoxide reductase heme-binding subunit